MRAVSLLAVVSRIHPEAWDAIAPHGPPVSRFRSRADLVSLNPQPLPPGPGDPFLVEAATMANTFVRMAVEADLRGESMAGQLSEWIDEWCGTPWPRKWPWPWPVPRRDEGPQPDPWNVDAARVVGAMVFASAASRLADGELSNVLLEGADRLAEVATANG